MTWIGLCLVAAGGYLLLCLADPEGTCWTCGGYGTGRVARWRVCRRCGGDGVRRRLGARLIGRRGER
jgi:hypothetical protein